MKKFFYSKGAMVLCTLLLGIFSWDFKFRGSFFLLGEPEMPEELKNIM